MVYVTVTVTKALALRPILEDRRRITESISVLVPVNRIKQKCFQIVYYNLNNTCSTFSSKH